MYNPDAAVLPAKRTPQRTTTAVLTIATATVYAGFILIRIGAVKQFKLEIESTLAGVCMLFLASILYVLGLALYRKNSGKSIFVGYVVQAAHPVRQEANVLPNANQPLLVNVAQQQAQYFPSYPTQPSTEPPSMAEPPLASPLYQPPFQAAAVADAPPEYTDAGQLIKHRF